MDLQKFYNERKKDLLIKKGQSRDYISESDVVALLEELQKQLAISRVVVPKGTFYCRDKNDEKNKECNKQCKLCKHVEIKSQ